MYDAMKLTAQCFIWIYLLTAAVCPVRAAGPPAVPPAIQKNYDDAKSRYRTHPHDDEAAWQFAHACYDRAEFPRNDAERAALADEGIEAARKVIAHQPRLAAGHYFLGANLAELARTKTWGALSLVRQMEKEWLMTLALDENLDYGGADRNLGLLYRDAPPWPISVGNRGKAQWHLERAVKINAGYPENYLNLIESDMMWGKTAAATDAWNKLQALLPAARKQYTGGYWEPSWNDWDSRAEKIQAALKTPREPSTVHRR